MVALRNNKKADEMKSLYNLGLSLSQIALAFGVSRQSVYKMLKRRKFPLRKSIPLPFLMWQGRKFTLRKNGYYAKTIGRRAYLHREIWTFYHGPIPAGFDVHHKDEDKTNNRLENLELLTESEHGSKHGFGGNQYIPSLGRRPVR